MYTNICIYICMYIYIYMYVCTDVYMYMYIYIICIYIYIYDYTYTYVFMRFLVRLYMCKGICVATSRCPSSVYITLQRLLVPSVFGVSFAHLFLSALYRVFFFLLLELLLLLLLHRKMGLMQYLLWPLLLRHLQ